MKPINVKCPICGENMIAMEWGKIQDVLQNMGGKHYLRGTYNYVNYECNCGNRMNYKGAVSCWKKCPCQE